MTADRAPVIVETSLDNLRSDDVRLLEEAAAMGPLHVRVPSDALVAQVTGAAPRFPAAERVFLAEAIRWVARAEVVERPVAHELARLAEEGAMLVTREENDDPGVRAAARTRDVRYAVVSRAARSGFPVVDPAPSPPGRPRVIVTGCYDRLHSGHVRFFMDAAALGELHVVVGSDANVALLKGPGHPLLGQDERRYMVGAVRSVHRALISTGTGWLDAEPEIDEIAPHVYVVNEDGDQPEKREFCRARGVEYVVLQRRPHPGLPPRTSTDLRGF